MLERLSRFPSNSNFPLCIKRDFPGDPVVKTPHLQSRGMGSIPGRGTKILHATQCGQKKKKFNFKKEKEGS